jgi:hypothetical protein
MAQPGQSSAADAVDAQQDGRRVFTQTEERLRCLRGSPPTVYGMIAGPGSGRAIALRVSKTLVQGGRTHNQAHVLMSMNIAAPCMRTWDPSALGLDRPMTAWRRAGGSVSPILRTKLRMGAIGRDTKFERSPWRRVAMGYAQLRSPGLGCERVVADHDGSPLATAIRTTAGYDPAG